MLCHQRKLFPTFTQMEFILALLAATIVGLNKAGLKGIGVLAVVLLALAYGSRASTGIIVPILIVGDILAVTYYKRHVKWKYLIKLIPAVMIGVLVAVYYGKNLDEAAFKFWMALLIFASLFIILYREFYKQTAFPNTWFFAGSIGIVTGFTTMIGNLAGGFANIFFLATGLPKNEIIGTSAWLFMIINVFKLPFHIWSWETITMKTFLFDLSIIPAVFVGFYLGIKLVAKFNEQFFRYFLIGTTALGAILILLK